MAETGRADGRRAALVYNPIKVDAKALRAQVELHARKAGWHKPAFYETTVHDAGRDAATRALADGADAVLVAGGDGTVRSVAEAMSQTRVPLTIVPSGTGNLFARNLLLPLTRSDAMIEATFSGDLHSVDVGEATLWRSDGTVEELVFVVMAGIGLDAAMIANTSPQLKKSVGWIAYIDGAARSLAGAKPFRATYQLAGRRMHSAKVHSILFANCGMLPAGIELIPDASITDGQLDVAIIQPTGWFGWIGVWRKVWWDNSVLLRTPAGRRIVARRHDTAVRYLRGTQFEAGVDEARHVQLDGDEFGEASRMRCRIIPGGLMVAVPKGHRMPGR